MPFYQGAAHSFFTDLFPELAADEEVRFLAAFSYCSPLMKAVSFSVSIPVTFSRAS